MDSRLGDFSLTEIPDYITASRLLCNAGSSPVLDLAMLPRSIASYPPREPWWLLVIKHDVDQRALDDHPTTVVVDITKTAKPIEEEADARPCGADHVGQRFLADFG